MTHGIQPRLPIDPIPGRPVRVLIVEDSAVVRELLMELFSNEPGMTVIGVAADGAEAIAAVERLRPDVITMDINMPKMNGFEATRQIMRRVPTPIVIVSASWDPQEVRTTFQAVEAGAVAVLPRPRGVGHPDFNGESRTLVQTVRAMAEVKVVRRWAQTPFAPRAQPVPAPIAPVAGGRVRPVDLIAIGASTGGPAALHALLTQLPANLSFPIVIVQHIAAGFVEGFVEWLVQSTRFPVHLAKQGMTMQPGHAYVAPDRHHLAVGPGGTLLLRDTPPEAGLRPAVGHLFRSVAQVYGGRAGAVLLTGMGADGAAELKQLKDLGAPTIAQDRASCVVFGMPGEAIKRDAATWVLSPEAIAALLVRFSTTN
jgi:two-component system, chemotaxis family, protein-glutamate methylesterase/glutaminase